MAAIEPFWGESDSNVRWCEADYAVTPYVAEFWNSLTSVFIIIIGTLGVYVCWKHGLRLRRFYVAFGIIAITGIGSTLFHMTNRYWAQCLDELPMLWGNFSFLYCLIEAPAAAARIPSSRSGTGNSSGSVVATKTAPGQSALRAMRYPWLPYVMTVVPMFISMVYLYLPQFYLVFLLTYAVLVFALALLSFKRAYFDAFPATYPADTTPEQWAAALRVPRQLLWGSLLTYGAAFTLWAIENTLCPPAPLDRVLLTSPELVRTLNRIQLHAWWHIGAGIGTYLMVQFEVSIAAVSRLRAQPKWHFSTPLAADCCVIPLPHIRLESHHTTGKHSQN